MKSPRVTGIIFYSLVALWLLGMIIGMAANLPYVQRRYGGVTLPCFGGVTLMALTLSNYYTGAIWRGHSRAIPHQDQPLAFWLSLGGMGITGAVLLWLGLHNWMRLP
jgi:hypothetical protein